MFKLSSYLVEIPEYGSEENLLLYSTRSKYTISVKQELLDILRSDSIDLLPESLILQLIYKEFLVPKVLDESEIMESRNREKQVLGLIFDEISFAKQEQFIKGIGEYHFDAWKGHIIIWDTSKKGFEMSPLLPQELQAKTLQQILLISQTSLRHADFLRSLTSMNEARFFIDDLKTEKGVESFEKMVNWLIENPIYQVFYFVSDQQNLNLIIDQYMDHFTKINCKIRFAISEYRNSSEKRAESVAPFEDGFFKLIDRKMLAFNQHQSSSVAPFSLGYIRELNLNATFQKIELLHETHKHSPVHASCKACSIFPSCGGEPAHVKQLNCPTYKSTLTKIIQHSTKKLAV